MGNPPPPPMIWPILPPAKQDGMLVRASASAYIPGGDFVPAPVEKRCDYCGRLQGFNRTCDGCGAAY